ncbi:helix-turn-helix domain-containing protein [Streptomyces sp. NPDC012769]|uniref:helix-turn-helix domain-containing protein n=1 Tax=Streptomyces sp. NPDC012769 TaxID=3364848 RepID=UPI0036885BF2
MGRRDHLTEEQKAEARARAKQQYFLKQQGKAGYVDASEMQQRIRKLHDDHQITFQRISEKARVDVNVVEWHYHGHTGARPDVPLTQCIWRVHNAIMTTQFGPADVAAQIRSHGTQRRLRAMIAAGYPQHWLAEHTGRRVAQLNNFLVKEREYVSAAHAADVEQLYRKYADTDPVTVGVTSKAKAYSLGVARKRGYPPGTCWDDDTIDDPAAIPEWTGACGSERGYQIHWREKIPSCEPCRLAHQQYKNENPGSARARVHRDEILRLHAEGYDSARIAERLGVSERTVTRTIKEFTP